MAALLEVKTARRREEEAYSWREDKSETVPLMAGRRQSFTGSEKENWQGDAVWMQ